MLAENARIEEEREKAAGGLEGKGKKKKEGALFLAADDFFPLWLFVVIRAKLPNLISTIAFLETHCWPHWLSKKLGYYFTRYHCYLSFSSLSPTKYILCSLS